MTPKRKPTLSAARTPEFDDQPVTLGVLQIHACPYCLDRAEHTSAMLDENAPDDPGWRRDLGHWVHAIDNTPICEPVR